MRWISYDVGVDTAQSKTLTSGRHLEVSSICCVVEGSARMIDPVSCGWLALLQQNQNRDKITREMQNLMADSDVHTSHHCS